MKGMFADCNLSIPAGQVGTPRGSVKAALVNQTLRDQQDPEPRGPPAGETHALHLSSIGASGTTHPKTHTAPLLQKGGPCHVRRSAHFCRPTTFVSTQVDVQGCDHLPAQGLPPPHDHVDGPLPVEEGLDGLLLVLVDEVHVVDSQQPVIDPEEGYSQVSALAGLGTRGQVSPLQSGETRARKWVPHIHTQTDFLFGTVEWLHSQRLEPDYPVQILVLPLTSCVAYLLRTSVSSSVRWGQEQYSTYLVGL